MFGFESMLEEPEGLYDEELSGVEKRRSSNIVNPTHSIFHIF